MIQCTVSGGESLNRKICDVWHEMMTSFTVTGSNINARVTVNNQVTSFLVFTGERNTPFIKSTSCWRHQVRHCTSPHPMSPTVRCSYVLEMTDSDSVICDIRIYWVHIAGRTRIRRSQFLECSVDQHGQHRLACTDKLQRWQSDSIWWWCSDVERLWLNCEYKMIDICGLWHADDEYRATVWQDHLSLW